MPRPLRLILRMLATICLLAFLLGAAAHLRAGAAAAPWMKPTLTLTAMTVAIGGLLIIDGGVRRASGGRSEEHTSELQSLMRISYAVFCWKKKREQQAQQHTK